MRRRYEGFVEAHAGLGREAAPPVAAELSESAGQEIARAFSAGELSADGYAAYVWQDSAGSFNGDIVAQNLRMDGSLGLGDGIFGNGFEPAPTAPGR